MAAGRKIKELQRVSLENDSLKDARICFDQIVNDLLTVMNEKKIHEGEVTMKLSIKITEGCEDTPDGERTVLMPVFEHKITGSYKAKSELAGLTGGAEYELIQMDGGWGIKSFSNGQMELDV